LIIFISLYWTRFAGILGAYQYCVRWDELSARSAALQVEVLHQSQWIHVSCA